MCIRSIIRNMHAAYAENDFESYSSVFCDDIVYEVHIDKCVSACGGRTIGKDALYRRYSLVLKNFEKLVYRCLSVSVDGIEASSRIDYYYVQLRLFQYSWGLFLKSSLHLWVLYLSNSTVCYKSLYFVWLYLIEIFLSVLHLSQR